MQSKPRLWYIIPACNAQETLKATVQSVLGQTMPDVRAVIVDDGSTDQTRRVAEGLRGPRVGLLSQANAGLAAARNAGWREARGACVCFLDSDDVVGPDHAQRMLDALGDADAVACGYRFVGAQLEDLGWEVPVLPGDTTVERLLEVNRLAVGAVVMRSGRAGDLLRAADGIAGFDPSLGVHEDWDLFLRLTRAGRRWAEPLREPLFSYRLWQGSMSCAREQMWQVGLGVIARHAPDAAVLEARSRGWHLRSLARALAAEDGALIASIRGALGPIEADDCAILSGAIRWACARHAIVGPADWESHMAGWANRVRCGLAGERWCDAIVTQLLAGPHRWNAAIVRAQAMLEPGQPLVIYGYGRNGWQARRAAEAIGVAIVIADDDPAAVYTPTQTNGPVAIAPEGIEPGAVVLVTPEDRTRIIDRLRMQGVCKIILPDAA